MLGSVRTYMGHHNMLSPGDRVIVSVSGGPDSVALLHILHHTGPELGVSLHVFHLDHGLRGEASAEDALYVRELADRLGLPSTIVGLGPEVIKRLRGSVQATARAIRQAEIRKIALRIGANKVAVGHNLEDQAETVLMRLLRGTGLRGLSGIYPTRAISGLTYIRPLLETPRKEIERYCHEHELSPRIDASNSKSDYARNRIRLELLPELARKYNPAITVQLSQLAAVLREEDQLLDSLTDAAWARCVAPGEGGEGVALVGHVLLSEPLALARRVVRRAIREVAGPEADLGLSAVSQVLEAAGRQQGTHRLTLPGGVRVHVEYGICRFSLEAPLSPIETEPTEWPVATEGVTEIPELGLRVESAPGPEAQGPFEVALDAEKLPGPLAIRFRRPGDRMWLTGMDGSKKLQDILVDAKVPRRLRDRLPLLVSGDDVVWVIGHRLDRRFLAGKGTNRPLLVRVFTERSVP